MRTDAKGCSTCSIGQEHYESFTISSGKEYVQYDYRMKEGKLFSIVKPTLDACRVARDKWLKGQRVRSSSV